MNMKIQAHAVKSNNFEVGRAHTNKSEHFAVGAQEKKQTFWSRQAREKSNILM